MSYVLGTKASIPHFYISREFSGNLANYECLKEIKGKSYSAFEVTFLFCLGDPDECLTAYLAVNVIWLSFLPRVLLPPALFSILCHSSIFFLSVS